MQELCNSLLVMTSSPSWQEKIKSASTSSSSGNSVSARKEERLSAGLEHLSQLTKLLSSSSIDASLNPTDSTSPLPVHRQVELKRKEKSRLSSDENDSESERKEEDEERNGSCVMVEIELYSSVEKDSESSRSKVIKGHTTCRKDSGKHNSSDNDRSVASDKRQHYCMPRRMTSTPILSCQSPSSDLSSTGSEHFRRQNSILSISNNSDNDNEKEQGNSLINANMKLRKPSPVEERKMSVDRQNSERKMSDKNHLDAIAIFKQSEMSALSHGSVGFADKSLSNVDENHLLTQAKIVGPLLDEISALAKG